MSTQDKIEAIRILADRLPSGLIDPKALDKLNAEWIELKEAIEVNDVDAIMEACDVCYYAIKAEASGLVGEDWRDSTFDQVAMYLGLVVDIDVDTLLLCTIEKYQLRAAPDNPKNHQEERAAVITEINRSNLGVKVCQYCGKIGKPKSHISCQGEGVLNLGHCSTIEDAVYFLNRARDFDPEVKSHFLARE